MQNDPLPGKKNYFLRLLRLVHLRGKHLFDRFANKKLKHGILTAVPFWSGSFIVGVVAVIYAWLFHHAELLMFAMIGYNKWLLFLILPIGFILSWWIVKKFSPYASGSGIPQVMASIELAAPETEKKISQLLGLRTILVKVVSSLVLVLGGGAVGREGPTIQISGSVFQVINRLIPKWWPKVSHKNMILTGAAAGLSAAFNTPLGGIVFAVEELTKIHFSYFKTALFTAIIIAGLTAQQLAGSYLYLGYPQVAELRFREFSVMLIVAAVAGFSAAVMSKVMQALLRFKRSLKRNKDHILFLLATSLFIASFAYFLSETILSSGKDLMEHYLFTTDKHAAGIVPFSRILGNTLSFGTGGAGGIFAPALSSGAAIGSAISGWFQFAAPHTNVMILVGMVGFLTGVTRSPFTSAIIVLEMTDRHSIILQLMTAALVAYVFARIVSAKSLYEILKINYLRELQTPGEGTPPPRRSPETAKRQA